MSIADYESARKLILEHSSGGDIGGPRPEQLVRKAEQRLGVMFPPSYRAFLLEFGTGGLGGTEIYGVIHEDFDHSSVPDAVWCTLRKRASAELPEKMVVIYAVGDGELFCLDMRDGKSGEPPVVAFQPGSPIADQRWELIAEDFGAFLLEMVEEEIATEDELKEMEDD